MTFCKKIDTGNNSTMVSTLEPVNLTTTSATLKGHVSNSAGEFSDVGFIYDKAGALKKDSSPRVEGVLDGNSFSAVLKDLSSATDYEYIARAVVDGKEEYGKLLTFTTQVNPVTAIQITPSSLELFLGRNESAQLTAEITPPDASDPSVTWSSSAPAVATVSDKGLVQAVSEGKTVITAQSASNGKVKAECTVSVKYPIVTELQLNYTSAKICEVSSKTLQLVATVKPSDAFDKTLSWSSSDPGVATVSSDGLVTAVSSGSVTITVKNEKSGKTASCSIHVYYRPEAVDLGLSVKWAAANLGAKSSADQGFYGYWGWTDSKGDTVYSGGSTTLPPIYDAARTNLGGTWRLPTSDEMQELLDNCTWTWENNSERRGYKVTGKNSRAIFIPASISAGYYIKYTDSVRWHDTGSGYHWTATRTTGSSNYPHIFIVGPSNQHQLATNQTYVLSSYYCNFRPVCSK